MRQDGHEVSYVAELIPSASDEVVLEMSNEEGLLLVTADKDFGELVFRQRQAHHGVVLIRLEGLRPETKAAAVSAAISRHAEEMGANFVVVAPGTVRIRRSI